MFLNNQSAENAQEIILLQMVLKKYTFNIPEHNQTLSEINISSTGRDNSHQLSKAG